MLDECLIQRLSNKYRVRSQVFQETNTILINSALDEWKIIYYPELDRDNIKLMHKNTSGNRNNYHTQRYYSCFYNVFDSIGSHKFLNKRMTSSYT